MTQLELYERLIAGLERPACLSLRNRYREILDYNTRVEEANSRLILKFLEKHAQEPDFLNNVENEHGFIYRCLRNLLEDLRKKVGYPPLQNNHEDEDENDDGDGTEDPNQLPDGDETEREQCMKRCLRKLARQNPTHFALFALKELKYSPDEIRDVLLFENETLTPKLIAILDESERRYEEIGSDEIPEETVKTVLAEIFGYANVGVIISQIRAEKLQPCSNQCFENHGVGRV